ncbi:MAG: M20 family metallo-hydrolase [Ilumatobacteraceae bacterium]
MSDHASLRVDGERLWKRLSDLGEIGAVLGPNGERGCARLALSDEDRLGRDLVVTWMRDLGLEVSIDAIGNVIATRYGTDPTLAPVMTGSHIDTVRTGGRFDGNLGVLAGLEVLETLEQHGIETERSVQVGFFTDEEGARFAPDMLGSLVYVGGLALEDALDAVAVDNGARLGDELVRIGYSGATPCPVAAPPHAFVELHIEQGPVLEEHDVTIGVVTGVQGISWTEYTMTGRSAHAGTTPMRLRRDPLVPAAEVVVEARRLARAMGGAQVATVGRMEPFPDLINVVAQRVIFTLDLRNTDEVLLADAEARMAAFIEGVCDAEGCAVQQRTLARFQPVSFDPTMIERVERIASAQGNTTLRMPSGAGHDAQMLSRVCPTSMIFVPSVDGLSHNIAEYTAPHDLEAGANVLLHTLLEISAR